MSRGRAKRGAGAPSQRQLRVGEVIRHALAEILARGEVRDPDLEGLVVTVPEVRLSPDLKVATVYVMPLGGAHQDKVVAALSRHVRFLRGEVRDPDLEGLVVTVPEVRLSPDLKIATVYVMPLGGAREDKVVAALSRHVRFLRGEVARRVALRFMPELRFRLDTTFAESDRIEQLLRSPQVARDLHGNDE